MNLILKQVTGTTLVYVLQIPVHQTRYHYPQYPGRKWAAVSIQTPTLRAEFPGH